MATIQLHSVKKIYPTGVTAVHSLDLTVTDGEIVVLLGPTGCGKTTVLRLIAGLEAVTAGEIYFDNRRVDTLASHVRNVAMVFQDYALYPHLTVAENIAFPLLNQHIDESARAERVREVARLLGLEPLLHRRSRRLSGGQRQRVAMARAIARQPVAFLLDEPLSNLDANLRDSVRGDIVALVRRLGVAAVYVTHDQIEAMLLADRVAVMRQGRVEQVGTPEEVYADPQKLFVAAFVGSPRMNLLQAAVYAQPGERTVIDLGAQTLDLPWRDERAAILAEHHQARITVGLRPDALTLMAPSAAEDVPGCLAGTVKAVELRGHDTLVHLETGASPTPNLLSQLDLPDATGELTQLMGHPLDARPALRDRLARMVPSPRRPSEPQRYAIQPAYDPGQDTARQALGDLLLRVPAATAPRTGDRVAIAVDTDQLYFFDRAGDRIPTPVRSRASHRQAPAAG